MGRDVLLNLRPYPDKASNTDRACGRSYVGALAAPATDAGRRGRRAHHAQKDRVMPASISDDFLDVRIAQFLVDGENHWQIETTRSDRSLTERPRLSMISPDLTHGNTRYFSLLGFCWCRIVHLVSKRWIDGLRCARLNTNGRVDRPAHPGVVFRA